MLEKAIKDLTVAVTKLTEVTLAKGSCSPQAEAQRKALGLTKGLTKKEKEATATYVEHVKEIAESKENLKKATFDEMEGIIVEVAKNIDKGRDEILKVLKTVGAAKAPEVKEEDYCTVIDALNEVTDNG